MQTRSPLLPTRACRPRARRAAAVLALLLASAAAGCASPAAPAATPASTARPASGAPPSTATATAPSNGSAPATTATAAPTTTPSARSAAPRAAPTPAASASGGPTADPPPAEPTIPFETWLARFRADARAAGIDERTLQSALDNARFLPRVVELDRSQPEFTRPIWDYLDSAVSAQRVSAGRAKWREWRAQAEAAQVRYGVPPEIVMAIWGMESNYGSHYGDIPTIDALATLAYEGRRANWARQQLMAALRILQNGDIARSRMVGSWAGAMGQTQFLPTNFLAYAVDADGDGRRDIWGSLPDVIASTAHFLQREGWQAGQTWGTEVRLPAGFDVGRADDALRQTSVRWAAEGLTSIDGTPLPPLTDAFVLLPTGALGPAFLVGPNYRAILRYNSAMSYALGVGLLAQRIGGGPGVQAAWPRDLQPLSRSDVRALQEALNGQGFDSGGVDGMLGPATRGAIRRYQRSLGLAADGFPTMELLRRAQRP